MTENDFSEVYLHESEMPKDCIECKLSSENVCDVLLEWQSRDEGKRLENCPLRSLEQHDAEVRKETAR